MKVKDFFKWAEDKEDHFNVLRKINNKPQSTQRELARELGFSLGKLNYCL